jgi:hypothetical protein
MFDEDNNKNALLISADSNIRRKDSNAIKSFQKLFPQATLKSFCEIIGGIFSTSIYFSASDYLPVSPSNNSAISMQYLTFIFAQVILL